MFRFLLQLLELGITVYLAAVRFDCSLAVTSQLGLPLPLSLHSILDDFLLMGFVVGGEVVAVFLWLVGVGQVGGGILTLIILFQAPDC